MKKKIYIAAPFFNPAQLEIVKWIEERLDAVGLDFFSPRLGTADQGPFPLDAEKAQRIFELDIEELEPSDLVIAVLDWAMPEEEYVRLVRPNKPCVLLNIPDSGTVWEMGSAYATEIPVVGFTLQKKGKINLMLTQSCFGICYGWTELETFFNILSGWRGEYE